MLDLEVISELTSNAPRNSSTVSGSVNPRAALALVALPFVVSVKNVINLARDREPDLFVIAFQISVICSSDNLSFTALGDFPIIFDGSSC